MSNAPGNIKLCIVPQKQMRRHCSETCSANFRDVAKEVQKWNGQVRLGLGLWRFTTSLIMDVEVGKCVVDNCVSSCSVSAYLGVTCL